MRYVCAPCRVPYRPEKNGVRVLETNSGPSERLHAADLYKCPSCGHELISGFSTTHSSSHEETFAEEKAAVMPGGKWHNGYFYVVSNP